MVRIRSYGFHVQGIELTSFKLNTHRIYRDLSVLRTDPRFNGATFLHPVSRAEDVYTLHTYFSRVGRPIVRMLPSSY